MKLYLTRLHHTMKANNSFNLTRLICLICVLLIAPASMAGSIKCWTNKDGIRECGYSVPPEYSQKRIEIMNQRGVKVDVREAAKTKEQLAEEARLAELKKEELRRQEEARLRDTILLNTFTTERDLKISYDDKLEVIKGVIEITNTSTRSLQNNLNGVQKKAANYERAGETTPENVLKQMESLERQLKENDEFITRKEKEIQSLNNQYEADLKRFRELKGIEPKKPTNSAKM